ncbi:ras guanine nucleotide exchange factor domain-containing protein, partial [Paraphysoderma sedebokerense]
IDYTFLSDFFVIYRMFMSPVQLAKLLILRFRWGMLSESDERCLVRMRTFIVLRHWISEFYNIDFVTSRPLRVIVITFINELSHNPTIRASVRDLRIVKTLKKLVKKHDSDYKLAKDLHASSGCSLSLTDWLWQQEIIREYEPLSNAVLHRENSQSKEKRFKSFILNYKSEVIAQQFALIEQTALRCIKWTELLDDNWKSNQDGSRKSASGQFDATNETGFTLNGDDGNEWIGGIKSMIDRFNLTCQWIATEICSTKNFDERVKVIEKLIRIALKCHHLHNYSTCTAIILGLQNPQVDRLKKTWNKVSAFEKKAFKDLIGFISPCKNFSGLREAMKTVCENAGGLGGAGGSGESSNGSTDDGKGVPFVGVYLFVMNYSLYLAFH